MFARVTLNISDGNGEERKYVYESRTHVVIGRADDCDIQLYGDVMRAEVSRHHCELEIEPPGIRARDLGSLNGTYVNGRLIGQRDCLTPPDDGSYSAFGGVELRDGDELRVGHVVFRIGIFACEEAVAPIHFF